MRILRIMMSITEPSLACEDTCGSSCELARMTLGGLCCWEDCAVVWVDEARRGGGQSRFAFEMASFQVLDLIRDEPTSMAIIVTITAALWICFTRSDQRMRFHFSYHIPLASTKYLLMFIIKHIQ